MTVVAGERIRGTLGELLPLKYGKSLPAALRDATGSVPVFGSSGVVGHHSSALTGGPTIIVGRKGNVGAVHFSAVPCWPIDTAYFVEPPAGHAAAYYRYLLTSLNLVKLDKSTAIPGLSRDDYNAVEVAIHSPAKQREIVAELEKQFSRLDEAVANLQRVKANLKRYKASVLKAAVEGRLVETEASLARREGRAYETGEQLLQRILEERRAKWSGRGKYKLPASPMKNRLPPIPEGWIWANADQLTHLITSGSRGWGDFYSDTGVLFIRAQDIKTDALNLPDAARVDVPIDAEGTRSSVSEGNILVTITGANVTKSALVPALGELAFVSQHVALMKLAMPETASFVFNWIISPANGRKTLESWAYGAGKPGLSLEQVRALPIALPPLAEQARIDAEVDHHLSIIREVEAEVDANLKRAQALHQSVLTKAFSGELPIGSLQPVGNTASEARPSKPMESATVVIAARIIAAHCHEPTFGRVRLQKQLHLATYIAQLATNDEYARKQAGPLDMTMLSGVTNRVNDLGWFRETARADKVHGGRAYGYSALTKADEYKQHLKALTPAQQKIIDELIRLMRNWTTEQCELFSTVYAAWNDLILWNLPPTEQAVVDQVHNHWHESKKKFSAEKIVEMMSKIRGWGYTPMGFGRPTFGETADTVSGDLFSSQAD